MVKLNSSALPSRVADARRQMSRLHFVSKRLLGRLAVFGAPRVPSETPGAFTVRRLFVPVRYTCILQHLLSLVRCVSMGSSVCRPCADGRRQRVRVMLMIWSIIGDGCTNLIRRWVVLHGVCATLLRRTSMLSDTAYVCFPTGIQSIFIG